MADNKNASSSNETSPKNEGIRLNPKQVAELFENQRSRAEAIGQRLNNLENMLLEVNGTNQLLGELKSGKGSEMMVPIGSGFFITVERKNGSIVKSMAGNVLLPLTPEEAILDTQKVVDQLKKELEKMTQEHQTAIANLQQLDAALYQLSQKQQATQQALKKE